MRDCWDSVAASARWRKAPRRRDSSRPWRGPKTCSAITKKPAKTSASCSTGRARSSKQCRPSGCGYGRKARKILKPAWKKFWLCASAAAAALMALPLLASGGSKPAAETSLAGLKPGKDTDQVAYRRFRERYEDSVQSVPPHFVVWRDPCNRQQLEVTMGITGFIAAVVVEHEFAVADA